MNRLRQHVYGKADKVENNPRRRQPELLAGCRRLLFSRPLGYLLFWLLLAADAKLPRYYLTPMLANIHRFCTEAERRYDMGYEFQARIFGVAQYMHIRAFDFPSLNQLDADIIGGTAKGSDRYARVEELKITTMQRGGAQ